MNLEKRRKTSEGRKYKKGAKDKRKTGGEIGSRRGMEKGYFLL